MEPKKLYRSRSNKWLAGVCGGIGEYTGIDPTIIRVVTILSGIGFVAYLVLALVVPESPV